MLFPEEKYKKGMHGDGHKSWDYHSKKILAKE